MSSLSKLKIPNYNSILYGKTQLLSNLYWQKWLNILFFSAIMRKRGKNTANRNEWEENFLWEDGTCIRMHCLD